jgi:hypothetical protein
VCGRRYVTGRRSVVRQRECEYRDERAADDQFESHECISCFDALQYGSDMSGFKVAKTTDDTGAEAL